MKLKHFTADNMKEAMITIKRELGDGAVILSSRKVKQGNKTVLDVTAAVETSMNAQPLAAFDKEGHLSFSANGEKLDLGDCLLRHGVAEELMQKIIRAAEALEETGFTPADVLEMVIGKMVPFVPPASALPQGFFHVFVGPAGAGKTTTLAKLAVSQRMNGSDNARKVGIIGLDTLKIGGFEQLKVIAEAMKETAHAVKTDQTGADIAASLADRAYVFVDTPGVNMFNRSEVQNLLKRLNALNVSTMVHLVLPATINKEDMPAMVMASAPFKPHSVIFTRLDEARFWGGIVNVGATCGLNVCYATDGVNLLNDIMTLDAKTLAQTLAKPPKSAWGQ